MVDMLAPVAPGHRACSLVRVGETFRLCHTIVAGRKLCSPARPERNPARVDFYIAAICFPIIFLGELPDKTMFASLLLSTRGRPVQVWLGAAAAFTVHVTIAVSAGGALFTLVPRSYLDLVVAGLFAAGAIYAWIEGTRNHDTHLPTPRTARGAVTTAFVVIFLAEWGDLTQILTANLAAHYHAPLPVALGSLLALWVVAALAVASGQTMLRFLSITTIRKITAIALLCLAGYTAWTALG